MRSRLPAALASVAGFACTTFTFYLIANYDGASLYADDRGAAGNWFRSRRPGQALGTDPIASLALANPSEYAVKCSASTTAERVVELYASRWDVVNVLLFPTSPKLAADAAPLAALCGAPVALNQFGGDPVVRCPSQWFSAAYGCVDTPRPSSGPLWRRLELPPAERTTRVTTTTARCSGWRTICECRARRRCMRSCSSAVALACAARRRRSGEAACLSVLCRRSCS
jgi:hypothetical protein